MKNKPTAHYPIFLNLKNRRVVVIGGGAVAERKIRTLIQSGADITNISPKFTSNLIQWNKAGKIKTMQRVYREGDLKKTTLAFTATDQREVNLAVAREATKEQVWLNVADQSTPGDFWVPAIFSADDATIAVSSQMKNPRHAVEIRDRIKAFLSKNEPY